MFILLRPPHTPTPNTPHIPTITLLQELLRLLEEEEVRANALNAAQQELQTKYRGALQEVATVRTNVQGEVSQLRDALKSTQQREREGRLDLEASKEKQSGLRMTLTSLEEKLIRVSQSNVEANGANEERRIETKRDEERQKERRKETKKERRKETKRDKKRDEERPRKTQRDVDGFIELNGLTQRISRSIDT